MCGIAGRFHPAQLAPEPSWAARASALLAHRGPDGEGHWEDERCDLVHRRLALIDLSPTGAQPMSNEDGAVLVVYNGEIYNYRALTAELKARGHRFRSTSDTEVLVHLYEDEGERMVARLRGIFAFAIYDRRRGRLFLARDRFGVKPLFFTVQDGEWAFASEMKALLALPGFRPEIDRQACYDFLGLGYIPEPATGFANIQALPRGSCLTISRQGHHLREYEPIAAHRDRGIICALWGDGGDEAFGGYASFWRANRLMRLMRLPRWVAAAAQATGRGLTRWTQDWGRQVSKAARLAHAGRADSAVLLAGLANYLSEDQKRALVLPAARAGLLAVHRHFTGQQPPGVSA